MTTRYWLLLGLSLTPALVHCTEITDRKLDEQPGGSAGSSGATQGGTSANNNGGSTEAGEASGGSSAGTAQGGNSSAGSGGSPSGGTDGAGTDSGGTDSGGTGSGGEGGGGHKNDGVLGHPDPDFDYPVYTGFTLYMVEEFNEALDLANDPIWTYSDGGPDEGSIRYTKSQLSFVGGKLRISALAQATPQSASFSDGKAISAKANVSGELRTKYNNFRYGRYEASLKVPSPDSVAPAVNGNYITGLSIFRQPRIQDWRQISMEMTGNSAGALTTIVNYANNQAAWAPGIEDAASASLGNGFTSRTATHVYAFEWTTDQIVWSVDGTVVRTGSNSGANDLNVDVPEKSAKILLNLWVFANSAYGGDPANNKYPLYTDVDWFRFYRWNDDTMYPCTPVPTCLSAADKDKSKNNAEDGVADL